MEFAATRGICVSETHLIQNAKRQDGNVLMTSYSLHIISTLE